MKVTHRYRVRARLPEELEPLLEIAMNLGWITYQRAEDIFHRIETPGLDLDGLDPISKLWGASQQQLDALAADATFVARTQALLEDLRASLTTPRWFQLRHQGELDSVAYFSPEYGIAQALPQYSGGLGVLAGDHLKSASDLGIPLTAVGLFYHFGYFTQTLDENGWQREYFPELDPAAMSLTPVDTRVTLPMGDTEVHVQTYHAQVGRVSLYLLNTDVDDNDEQSRHITDRLYGGGPEERIRQELVLGVGGMRHLEALGLEPQVFHLNEGHAGFLALERIRCVMGTLGCSFDEALEAVRPANVFTTHTPVPAGIDRFDRELVQRYLGWWCDECEVSLDDLMALGHEPGTPEGAELNMAVLGLRVSAQANGVSKLHGEVSRSMFHSLWPDILPAERPIGSVTNGVHGRTWISREMHDLLDRHIGHDWPEAAADRWAAMLDVPDEQLRAVTAATRDRLVRFVRHRLRRNLERNGSSPAEAAWADSVLDPKILTVGFARRFATYKRATLLLQDRSRLEALLLNPDRPVQFVFAGKAHPADDPGKHLLQAVAETARDPRLRDRFVFIEDYDIEVGGTMYQGVDVWLNNPIRPREACGTSGMKVVFNGGLNCSVLDGWWAEFFEEGLGWAIPTASERDGDHSDDIEAHGLYRLLEDEILPLFYDRANDGLPTAWLDRMRASMSRLCPEIEGSRMLRQYVEEYYEPAARHSARLLADGAERARLLAAWKHRVRDAWPQVSIVSVDGQGDVSTLGSTLGVQASVSLGSLDPDDVALEVLYGQVGLSSELTDPSSVPMTLDDTGPPARYTAQIPCLQAGTFGYTVRVLPRHPDLEHPATLGCVCWTDVSPDEQGEAAPAGPHVDP